MGQKKIKINTITEEIKDTQSVKNSPETAKSSTNKTTGVKSKTEKNKKAPRSKSYQEAIKLIDRSKNYPVDQAVELVKKVSLSKFDGSVEVSAIVKKIGLKGEVKFPHPTGKSKVIKVVDEKIIAELEKGQINFDTLIASPQTMPKIVKFAKLLGPKGLMPNPKNKTVIAEPEKRAKEMASKDQFKTESKQPIIHQVIGKISQKEAELAANLNALLKAIGENNLVKVVISPSIGPGIKIELEKK